VYFNRTINKVWQVAKELHLADGEVSNLELVADAQGKALAVWQHDQGLFASSYSAGAFDLDPKQISVRTDSNATAPSIAMIANGDALVAWQEEFFPGDVDIVVRPYLGGVWQEKTNLTNNNSSPASSPSVALREDQDFGTNIVVPKAVVAWVQMLGANPNLVSRSASNLQPDAWGDAITLALGDDGTPSEPRVALDARGDQTIIWLQQDGALPSVSLWAQRNAGRPVKIESGDGKVNSPALGVDAQGRALVIWTQDLAAPTSMRSNLFDPVTGDWRGPVSIGSGVRALELAPVLAMNANGRAIAGWEMNPPLPDDAGGRNVMANIYNEPSSPSNLRQVDQ
jgi:hypothetical protein